MIFTGEEIVSSSGKEIYETCRVFLGDLDEREVTEIAIVASAETMEKLEETNM